MRPSILAHKGHACSAVTREWASGRFRSEADLTAYCSAKVPLRGIAPTLWRALQTVTSAIETRANAKAEAKRQAIADKAAKRAGQSETVKEAAAGKENSKIPRREEEEANQRRLGGHRATCVLRTHTLPKVESLISN